MLCVSPYHLLINLFFSSVPFPPSDLVISLKFIDFNPVITLSWDMNVSDVAENVHTYACVYKHAILCNKHNYVVANGHLGHLMYSTF